MRIELLSGLIGRPWVANAAGPAAFDGWHLARHVEAVLFRRDLPDVDVPTAPTWRWMIDTIEAHPERARWRETEPGPHGLVQAGDGALVLMARSNRPAHIGVWLVPERRVLHADETLGVLFETLAMLHAPGCVRDLAMFNLAIDSKLRGCDLVSLRVEDIAPHGFTVDRATVRQRKTGHPIRFEMTEQTREAVDTYLNRFGRKPGQYLFANRPDGRRSLSTRQYARLLTRWTASVGLDPKVFGTHSLRRTKAALIYRRTGNLRAVQRLLGHTKIESTVRYLGIDIDDALTLAEQVEV